jgi:hypothetical protein
VEKQRNKQTRETETKNRGLKRDAEAVIKTGVWSIGRNRDRKQSHEKEVKA